MKTGVFLDWDTVADEKIETYNEIDVIVMDGVEPAFVSCKNGAIPVDELYKLNAVAERFGGKYAKKVLVASGLGNLKSDSGNRAVFIDENIRDRAGEMKIKIIDSNCFKTEARLQKALKNLFLP